MKTTSLKGLRYALAIVLVLFARAVWAEAPVETRTFGDEIEAWNAFKDSRGKFGGYFTVGFRYSREKETTEEAYTYGKYTDEFEYFTFTNQEGITLELLLKGGDGDQKGSMEHPELGVFIKDWDSYIKYLNYWFFFIKTYGFDKETKEITKQFTFSYEDRVAAKKYFFTVYNTIYGTINSIYPAEAWNQHPFQYRIAGKPKETAISIQVLREDRTMILSIPYEDYTLVVVVVGEHKVYNTKDWGYKETRFDPVSYVEAHPKLFFSRKYVNSYPGELDVSYAFIDDNIDNWLRLR